MYGPLKVEFSSSTFNVNCLFIHDSSGWPHSLTSNQDQHILRYLTTKQICIWHHFKALFLLIFSKGMQFSLHQNLIVGRSDDRFFCSFLFIFQFLSGPCSHHKRGPNYIWKYGIIALWMVRCFWVFIYVHIISHHMNASLILHKIHFICFLLRAQKYGNTLVIFVLHEAIVFTCNPDSVQVSKTYFYGIWNCSDKICMSLTKQINYMN